MKTTATLDAALDAVDHEECHRKRLRRPPSQGEVARRIAALDATLGAAIEAAGVIAYRCKDLSLPVDSDSLAYLEEEVDNLALVLAAARLLVRARLRDADRTRGRLVEARLQLDAAVKSARGGRPEMDRAVSLLFDALAMARRFAFEDAEP
ncbi:MAG: hypothetical protein IT372_38490 [Polyangiaceae bacterium]|nr:hypothetical protein [Polyangiaceae bacterium]